MKSFYLYLKFKFSIGLLLFLAFGGINLSAQEAEIEPVKWTLTIETKNKNLVKDSNLTARLNAEIEKGWHLYALEKIENGPIPTRISLVENQPFELGKIVAPKPIETDDTAFGVVTKFYEVSAEFGLPLRVLENTDAAKLQVKVYYQICNDEICLPPKSVIVESDFPEK